MTGGPWRALTAFLLLGVSAVAGAEVQRLPASAGSIDLPAGWRVDAGRTHYSNRSGEAALQVAEYPAGSFANPRMMARAIEQGLGAQGDGAAYRYSGREAFIADITFQTEGEPCRGYLITIAGQGGDVALLGYALQGSYDRFSDEILSVLDSYAPDSGELRRPGPVSQFLAPEAAGNQIEHGKPMTISVGGKQYQVEVDVREIDAAQGVIERETRVLAENKTVNRAAWQRYYRVIFRDNYHRIDPFLPAVVDALGLAGKSDRDRAAALLAWMQGFLYARTGTFTDFTNPVLALVTSSGDCDSRTLLYSILLEHLGMRPILMVSSVYSHSLVGVPVPGVGARYEYNRIRYLVAELTAPVALGMIDRSMADPSGWIPVDFPHSAPVSSAGPALVPGAGHP